MTSVLVVVAWRRWPSVNVRAAPLSLAATCFALVALSGLVQLPPRMRMGRSALEFNGPSACQGLRHSGALKGSAK